MTSSQQRVGKGFPLRSKYKIERGWVDICTHQWYAVKNPKAKKFSFTNDDTGEPDGEPLYIKQCKYCHKYE